MAFAVSNAATEWDGGEQRAPNRVCCRTGGWCFCHSWCVIILNISLCCDLHANELSKSYERIFKVDGMLCKVEHQLKWCFSVLSCVHSPSHIEMRIKHPRPIRMNYSMHLIYAYGAQLCHISQNMDTNIHVPLNWVAMVANVIRPKYLYINCELPNGENSSNCKE